VLSGYSRLVIDCNRDPADPSSIPETSDGTVVLGNRNLSTAARAARRRACFDPYHHRIAAWLAAVRSRSPALLSIHSFTPVMQGKPRPWHVGILWDKDPRIPLPLLAALRAEPGLVVGDNEPYSAREPAGYTVRQHAALAGLPHVAIELRQDLVADAAGAADWAARLAAALAPILAPSELYRALPPAL
jgi:predicted N-formylglutamate amidohydrolase